MANEFQVLGQNSAALFSLKAHRGDGMVLLGMNWKNGKPPDNFVGFSIEYKEPNGDKFYALKNRISFPSTNDSNNSNRFSTLRSPIQKFRWVHFPRNANLPGEFTYKVSPVFMNDLDELSYGESQIVNIELNRETYPNQLNVAYTRGFVSSQAFVDYYESSGKINTLLPLKASNGLKFTPTHSKKNEALPWMGFEAREVILEVLDKAIDDKTAEVRVIAYDLNEPEIVKRLEKLGKRLMVIIDNDGAHGKAGSAENQAEKRLKVTAGKQNVKRQHMGKLQHNKMIVINGTKIKVAICGSTNFSWRGLYVQSNNVLALYGKNSITPFLTAFQNFWDFNSAADFSKTASAEWSNLDLNNINAKVSFSPHSKTNALLSAIADDVEKKTTSSLLYSLAFLFQTPGVIKNSIKKVTANKKIFVYGISDKKVGGIVLQKPDGNEVPVYASALTKNLPQPFKSEPSGGGGVRMHHKFIVIDFDKPTARVYLGSYNFSDPADTKNGENLLLIRDRKIAVSYMIQALTIYDHYHFRIKQHEMKKARKKLELSKPPRKAGEKAWWVEDYKDAVKIKDRELFG